MLGIAEGRDTTLNKILKVNRGNKHYKRNYCQTDDSILSDSYL